MEKIFYAVGPLQTCMSQNDNFKFKCCNLISETAKTYNLTYHNYQYLIMMTILNLPMMTLKALRMTRLTTTLMTVILTRTVVNIILMIKAVLLLITWMMSNNWYMTGLMSHDS